MIIPCSQASFVLIGLEALLLGVVWSACPQVTIPADICVIQNDIAALKQSVNQLNENNNQLSQKVEQLAVRNSQLQAAVEQADSRIDNLEKEMKRKRHQVAFSARTTATVAYDPNQVIQFPSVGINEGRRYNNQTGKFGCADSGLYVFTASILSGFRSTWFQIVQDGNVRADGYTGDEPKESATHVAVVRCRPGSQVWVRRKDIQHAYKHTVWEVHSEFSGFRLAD